MIFNGSIIPSILLHGTGIHKAVNLKIDCFLTIYADNQKLVNLLLNYISFWINRCLNGIMSENRVHKSILER